MKAERLFKILNVDATPCYGGNGKWSLPTFHGPGDWMPPIANIALCQRGYHLCREDDLVNWLGPTICLADYRGERKDNETKIVVSEARLVEVLSTWTEETARLFAADCAERVLVIYENKYPQDDRPRKAIIAARQYAMGLIKSAAWSAAQSAAWSAAQSAAWSAARSAVEGAAEGAAWSAALGAERKWQTQRLMQYLFAV